MFRPFFLLTPLVCVALCGCHCFPASAIYDDAIDHFSDGLREFPAADDLYIEDLDVQRWCIHCEQPHVNCQSTFPRHRPR